MLSFFLVVVVVDRGWCEDARQMAWQQLTVLAFAQTVAHHQTP